jgi:peptidoglycan/LPS O-acetylase OafA/YrhL
MEVFSSGSGPPRGRLEHVDAMRPVKQLGVISTHSLLFFAPASGFVGAALMLLHASREGFLFVSACLLTYRYYDLAWSDLARFWRRRLLAVGVPYLCWTVIYFIIGLASFSGSAQSALWHFIVLVLTGYSQLYFLVVLFEFYLLFPAVVWLLRKTRRHHRALFCTSLVLQICYTSALHWALLPAVLTITKNANRELMSYQFYLLAGCLAAAHYDEVHRWLCSHRALVLKATLVTAALAQLWYWLAIRRGFGFLGSASDPFQPIVIPFNLAAISLIYLAGESLVRPRRTRTVRWLTRVSADNSFAVYLSQVLWLDVLAGLGWRHLNEFVPWPFVVMGAVLLVFVGGCLLGALLARTPLALPVAGRHRVPREKEQVPVFAGELASPASPGRAEAVLIAPVGQSTPEELDASPRPAHAIS